MYHMNQDDVLNDALPIKVACKGCHTSCFTSRQICAPHFPLYPLQTQICMKFGSAIQPTKQRTSPQLTVQVLQDAQ